MAKKYAKRKGISSEDIDRKHLFDLANVFDPEKIILGGVVSNLEGFLERTLEEFDKLYKKISQSLSSYY